MPRVLRDIFLGLTALLFLSCSGSKGQEGRMAMDDSITFRYAQLIHIYNIGDSMRARRIIEGTQEGRDILCVLEENGFR